MPHYNVGVSVPVVSMCQSVKVCTSPTLKKTPTLKTLARAAGGGSRARGTLGGACGRIASPVGPPLSVTVLVGCYTLYMRSYA